MTLAAGLLFAAPLVLHAQRASPRAARAQGPGTHPAVATFRAPTAHPGDLVTRHADEVRGAWTHPSAEMRRSARAEALFGYGEGMRKARDAASSGRLRAMRKALGASQLYARFIGHEVFRRDAEGVTRSAIRELLKVSVERASGQTPDVRGAQRARRLATSLARRAGLPPE